MQSMPSFSFQVRYDRAEVGVAAPLAVAVHRALYLPYAFPYGVEAVRDADFAVVVCVYAELGVTEGQADFADYLLDFPR